MTSPFHRAPQRTSQFQLLQGGLVKNPQAAEGFLLVSDRAYKSGAAIDYTSRRKLGAQASRNALIVPGFGGIKPAYGDFRDAMSDAIDGTATSYRHPRAEKGLVALYPDKLLHPDKLGKQSVAAMIDVVYEASDGTKVTLVGHSMGGPNSVEGALRRKAKVKEIVLLGAGGLEAGQNMIRLGKRMPTMVRQEGSSIAQMPHEDVISMFGQAAFHMARHPWRTGGEMLDIGNRDLMIDELNELRTYGIGIHAVQLELDSFFPTEIAEHDTRGLVDTFTVIPGVDHVAPQTHPELVAAHIAEVLDTGKGWFDLLPAPLEA